MKIWPYLAGAWFFLHGLSTVINLSFRYDNMVMGGLAIAAGFFVIIQK